LPHGASVPGRFCAGIARVIKLKLFSKLRFKVQGQNALYLNL